MKTCVYPGSFDPVTMGHMSIIERSARLFDTVYVALLDNTAKRTTLSKEDRIDFLNRVTARFDNVIVQTFDGLLVDYVKSVGAGYIVRGLRAVSDFEYEFSISSINSHLNDDIETVFFMTDTKYSFLSSSVIREVALFGGNLTGLVPAEIIADVQYKLKK